jgi:hypothetical protein
LTAFAFILPAFPVSHFASGPSSVAYSAADESDHEPVVTSKNTSVKLVHIFKGER